MTAVTAAPVLENWANPETVYGELMEEIAYALKHRPRELQKQIGPSEYGDPCDRALIGKLMQLPDGQEEEPVNWRAWVGSCMHTGLEDIFAHSFMQAPPTGPRFLLEHRVTVGRIGDFDLTGSLDLYDTVSCGVWDWKALPLSEPVATLDGWTTMSALQVGDQVLGTNYTTGTVTGIFPQGVRQVFRVEFSDGTFVRATADHLWTVSRLFGGKDRRWVSRTVRTDDLRTGIGVADRIAPLTPSPSIPDVELPIDPYVLGVWIGDGRRHADRYSDNTLVPISGGSAKRAVLQTVADTVGALVVELGQEELRVDTPIGPALAELGLLRLGSPKRFIPTVLLRQGSLRQRMSLLAGLLDCDGTVTTNCSTVYSTTSEQLAEDMAELVRSIGGWAKVWRNKAKNYYIIHGSRHYTGTTEYRVTLRTITNPFRHNGRNPDRWSAGGPRSPLHRFVKAVVPDGEELVQCIEVDHPNALFLTRFLIPTHNSKSATRLLEAKRHGMGQKYRVQFHSYGMGMVNAGYPVNYVGGIFMLRDGEFSDSFPLFEPYNPQIVIDALARANRLWALGHLLGAEFAMAQFPTCDQDLCRVCPGNYRPPFGPPRPAPPKTLAAAIARGHH